MATVEHCLYCFETLAAHLEKRTPMTLYQVQASWADYPKGLEDGDEDEDLHAESASEVDDDFSSDERPSSSSATSANKDKPSSSRPRIPAISRLSNSNSRSSTPSSTSTTSLDPSTAETTPASSSSNFVPIGLHPRRTSQRSSTITESPLFITWNTISGSSHTKNLRGCIGTFASEPLSSGLSSYALLASLSDHRFPPVTASELPSLEVAVTLLTDFETCPTPLSWEIGIHGIRISFYARNKRYGACYLPDVAVEQEWDKEETVISAMRKAGWGGKEEKWREVGDLKVVRFQGRAESLGWEEYRRWREWVDAGKKSGGE
ncbi:hypothetical protein BDZ45DRAFT_713602 [Acephala macrosclerotiorum]|nr:hypothetical protein BDZ45DRAFT_713602 [Acephala macrosclerotiorum]